MHQSPSKDLVKQLAARCGADLLALIDEAKDYVADARNGDWTTEARKLALIAIDEVLYNKIKKAMPNEPNAADDGMGPMI